ncbi:UVI-1 protein [Echria macrotheca]|uniref:UVI-1 protein n=1 Tax=Echria macrotheca TaxID=438768 RepID=A0AAJ0BE64_9PEZI|nr:UVI-1 protein [Echria macrotheca]
MRLSVLSAIFAAAGVLSAPTPSESEQTSSNGLPASTVVQNIQVLTTKSNALIGPAQQLSIVNAPLLSIGQGPWPTVITGLADIVITATSAITAMNNAPGGQGTPYVGDEATAIGNAFRTFVRVHQQLLGVLIGKAGFLTQIPFVGPPVAEVLRQVEGVVDTISFALIDGVEDSVASVMKGDLAGLDGTIKVAIAQYGGV